MEHTDMVCEDNWIQENYISNNFEKLIKIIGVNSSEHLNLNISKSNIDIDITGKKFVFLNVCPSFNIKLYSKVMYGNIPRMVMLASKIIKKAKDDFKTKAIQIFAKISSVLGFQHISYHPLALEENKGLEKSITLMKNILDIKGEKTPRIPNLSLNSLVYY